MNPCRPLAVLWLLGACSPTSDDTHDEEPAPPIEDSERPAPECLTYDSSDEDFAPVQTVSRPVPNAAFDIPWRHPTLHLTHVTFSGTTGEPASHEGIDYIHGDPTTSEVDIRAAAEGTVVYVRTGCPQSSTFDPNTNARECGSGWGNHIIIDHGEGLFTRSAHLAPQTTMVSVGDRVDAGTPLAKMGNSGRSQVRHLHFELGAIKVPFDPCAGSQSFSVVYDPAEIPALKP